MPSFPNTPLPVSKDAQKIVVRYLLNAQTLFTTTYNIRSQLEMRDRAYYREQDWTTEQQRAKAANNTQDSSKLQNITVPVVMPQVETALAAQTEVFLTGYPIFGVVADPIDQDAIRMFEAVIADNSIRSGYPLELMQALRDGFKYDLGAVEVEWDSKKIFSVGTPQLTNIEQGSKVEDLYAGNFIKRLDPYNLILDTRVSPHENHVKGEVAGYTELISFIEVKKRMEDLAKEGTMNFKEAFECGNASISTDNSTPGFYVPTINPDALIPAGQQTQQDMNWLSWAQLENKSNSTIKYNNSYEWTVLYARILPSTLGMNVPNPNTVQIWKFIIINRQVVIYAERKTNAHNMLPIIVAKPSNDGMGWQSKSFAQNAEPIQQVASSLMNSALASQRRKVYDRLLYDPTKVNKKDIENTSPVARIPVRNTQFGKGFEGAVQKMEYSDDGVATVIQMSQQVVQMGEILNGQNRVQQGQFQKGNKTRAEFETTMGGANSRQKMVSIALEYSFFTPIKEIIKSNILQFQPPTTLISPQDNKTKIDVDPTKMRGAILRFKMSDGLLSSELLASLDIANQVVAAATQIPQIAQEYDIMGIMSYSWKLRGVAWINDFKRDASGKAQYLAELTAQTTASGDMPPQPPTQPAPPPLPPGSALQ
jgi:hypothetical protein